MTATEANAKTPRLVRACRGETLDRPPVWLMRQAGRYMQEYQAVRSKTGFLELCKSPDLAAEVSLQPLNAFGMDGVIMFCDILVPCEAMGLPVEFADKGPMFPRALRTAADIDALIVPDPHDKMGFVMTLLEKLSAELKSSPETTLIGFAGAPWTLASYMIEGGGSKNFTHLKSLMYNEPATLHRLLDKLAKTVTLYLNAQIAAGAQTVQLFDTWGGIVPEREYREFVLPYQQQIFNGLKHTGVPTILYINGSSHILELMGESGADVVSVDWLTPLADARKRLGNRVALQGNLDPNALYAKPEVLQPMVEAMLREGGNRGYIFNLGHGILPTTPVDNVRLVVETVKNSARLFAGTPVS